MNISEDVKNKLKSFEERIGIRSFVSRFGKVDIAYPANEEEYCVLGGFAVVMVVAISDDQEELPIERAYFQLRDKEIIPLDKLGVCFNGDDFLSERVKEVKDDHGKAYFENVSFWSIPVGWFIDDEGFIAIDLKGERKAWVLLRGPWELHSLIREYLNKHLNGQIKCAEHIPFEVMAKFIEREFINNNRVQL